MRRPTAGSAVRVLTVPGSAVAAIARGGPHGSRALKVARREERPIVAADRGTLLTIWQRAGTSCSVPSPDVFWDVYAPPERAWHESPPVVGQASAIAAPRGSVLRRRLRTGMAPVRHLPGVPAHWHRRFRGVIAQAVSRGGSSVRQPCCGCSCGSAPVRDRKPDTE